MPRSAAAQAGIEVNGRRWRYEINLRGQPARLSDVESLVVGDCAAIRDSIVADVKAFCERSFKPPTDVLKASLLNLVEDLEMVDDDPEALSDMLNDLYDIFDFHRVCVVR